MPEYGKNIKLCYIWLENTTPYGGALTHFLQFLEAWESLGNKTGIITLKDFEYLNGRNILFDFQTRSRLFVPIIEFFKKKSIVEKIELGADIIYERYTPISRIKLWASKKNIPVFIEFNGLYSWSIKNWSTNPALRFIGTLFEKNIAHYERHILSSATRIFVVSNEAKKAVVSLGIPEEKIVLNPNGVDTKKFNPRISGSMTRKKYAIPNDAVVVGFIGTFGIWHGTEILARAAKEISIAEKNAYFMIMGDGHYRKQAEDAAGKHDRIIFTGPVQGEKVPEYLAACDILVNPTTPNPDGTEFFGSPTKLFEYMAMGKAVVSSNLGQMKDILENKKDALLVEAGNQNALKNAILELLKNKKLRGFLGYNARKKVVEDYTWKKNAERVLAVCQEITRGHNKDKHKY